MQIYAPNSDEKKVKKQKEKKEKKINRQQRPNEPVIATDPKNPRKSLLTITPEPTMEGVVCYAKNQIGRMQVPCAFSLTFVGKFFETV